MGISKNKYWKTKKKNILEEILCFCDKVDFSCDRLEDNLTGNVFGVLRYIPFNDPYFMIASFVYSEHVGICLHILWVGLGIIWYILISPTKKNFI